MNEVELTLVVVDPWSANESANPVISVELVAYLLSFKQLYELCFILDFVGFLPSVVPSLLVALSLSVLVSVVDALSFINELLF